MTRTITEARAMIERLARRESKMDDVHAREDIQDAAACIQSLITAVEQAEREALDAARWKALLSSPRIRILGTAGFDPATRMSHPDYRHFGMEIWSRFSDWPQEKNAYGREVLTQYADSIIDVQSRALITGKEPS